MDERLPGWQVLRRRLNRREWGETRQDAPEPPSVATERKMTLVQTEFWE